MLNKITTLSKSEFSKFSSCKEKKSFYTKNIICKYIESDNFQIGVVVSKKNGNAIIRNKIKRRMKEIIKNEHSFSFCSLQTVFICKPNVSNLTFAELKNEINFIAKNIVFK